MERDGITVHGLRSTFRDWYSEDEGNNFSREVCEHALEHRLPDKVKAAYRRGDLLDKRIILMQAWSDYCLPKKTKKSKCNLAVLRVFDEYLLYE